MQVEESQEMNRETLADQILPGAEVQSPLPYVWQLPNHGGNLLLHCFISVGIMPSGLEYVYLYNDWIDALFASETE